MSAIFTTDFLTQVAYDLTNQRNSLGNGDLILTLSPLTPNVNTVPGDFTTPDSLGYVNYTPYNIGNNGPPPDPVNAPDSFWSQLFGSASFDLSGGPGSDTIYGWGYHDEDNDTIFCSDTFSAPIPIAALPGGILVMSFTFGVRQVQYP